MITLLLSYLLLCGSAASWAAMRGRDFWTVFFIGIVISPLVVIGSLWTPFKANKSSLLKE